MLCLLAGSRLPVAGPVCPRVTMGAVCRPVTIGPRVSPCDYRPPGVPLPGEGSVWITAVSLAVTDRLMPSGEADPEPTGPLLSADRPSFISRSDIPDQSD